MSGHTRTDTTMSIHAHIKELRTRLFVIALVFITASMVVYAFRDPVIALLLSPLAGEKLSYLTPGGGFSFIFKVVMWGGIALSLPFLIFNIYKYISPILPLKAQKKSGIVLVASFLLLCAGAAFGYIYAIPGAMRFLLTFADGYVNAMLTADSYLNFVLVYTVGLGVLFQIPLLMVAINWVTPLKPRKLLGFERYVVVGAFVVAALITPTPDAVNQAIIAAPVVGMYQVGFIAVALSHHSAKRTLKRQAKKSSRTRSIEPKFGKGILRTYHVQQLVERKLQTPVAAPTKVHAPVVVTQPKVVKSVATPVAAVHTRTLPRRVAQRSIHYERQVRRTSNTFSVDGVSDRMFRIRPSTS